MKALIQIPLVVLLTLAAIVIHETGHFLVYTAAGYPTAITLQSVTQVGDVEPVLGLRTLPCRRDRCDYRGRIDPGLMKR